MLKICSIRSLALAIFCATTTIADPRNITVTFHSDGGCDSDPTETIGSPDNSLYYIDPVNIDNTYGLNSAKIADCNSPTICVCTFYTERNGGGTAKQADLYGDNCASDWDYGFKSFACAF
ncbi:hypothetical protein BGZ63DRAFT_404886 [Mariannaea sp. PMI_226]|nr:hypothetical protein BGZ63DRAFT_404886 [Mariannaea sp. PMI_226]